MKQSNQGSLAHSASVPALRSSGSYRADTDQSGRWCVWHRMGAHGWVITHACETRAAAEAFVDDLNRNAARHAAF